MSKLLNVGKVETNVFFISSARTGQSVNRVLTSFELNLAMASTSSGDGSLVSAVAVGANDLARI
jgi:hypothetical protein